MYKHTILQYVLGSATKLTFAITYELGGTPRIMYYYKLSIYRTMFGIT